MPEIREYDRARAVAYARRWARDRNPIFFDFTGRGGNCTNFVSQCILAGCCQMNFTPDFGWYYISPGDRAAAWTGVEFFYNFITDNAVGGGIGDGLGPFGREVRNRLLLPGDVIQLGRRDGDYYHTLMVTGYGRRTYLVSAQSDDALNRPLSTYNYSRIRYIHIEGYRTEPENRNDCFRDLIAGVGIMGG